MRKLFDPAHMLSHNHLNWRHGKQARVKLPILFSRIAFDIVEIHSPLTAAIGGLGVMIVSLGGLLFLAWNIAEFMDWPIAP